METTLTFTDTKLLRVAHAGRHLIPAHNGRFQTMQEATRMAQSIHGRHPGWNVAVRIVKATDADGSYEVYRK